MPRRPGPGRADRFWWVPVAVAQALLLKSGGFDPAHYAVHVVAAAAPVLAVLAHLRHRAYDASRVLLLVLVGHLVSVAPVRFVKGGTGGQHPARLSLPDSITGFFSAPELGWYAVCVGTAALVLVMARRRAATSPAGDRAW